MSAAVTAEELAQHFHDSAERLATTHGFVGRGTTWAALSEAERGLLVAVSAEVLTRLRLSLNNPDDGTPEPSWFHRLHHHHPHHPHHERRVIVSTTLKPGQSVPLTATAQYVDPASPDPQNPNYLTDTAAKIFGQVSVGGAVDTTGKVITLTEGDTTEGVATLTATYAGPGDAQVQAYAADPDGKTTPLSDPVDITCAAPNTDAVRVVITEGVPTP